MRVLVCGDRNWKDPEFIFGKLSDLLGEFGPDIIIIHGAARGADSIAGMFARAIGLPELRYPAEWEKYSRAAGMIRNKQMLDEGKPNLVVAFHDDLTGSKGTKGMISLANKAGIKVRHYYHGCHL